ncbi:MAG: glucose 1-dehydrogenase [Algoriphagus sp.]|nr:glucose 1-dehydrogenase [Algoriphagus sp.]
MKKTVIITGGTTGIGKATAIAFGKKGYNVVVTSRIANKESEIVADIKITGAEAAFYQLDVTDEQAVAKCIDHVVTRFGKLDTIVNNAGIALGAALLADSESEDLKQMLDTNVMGVFYGMKYAIKAMLKTGGGSIVNLASIAGANGLLYTAPYCASKHAVVGLTKGSAIDYATHGIRINAIAPGAIKTDIIQGAIDTGAYSEESIAAIHPMMRLGDAEDIANGIVFLSSDDCLFMTGTILFVDGGYNAK